MYAGSKRPNEFSSNQPSKKRKITEEEEEDPLEAFMKGINKTAAKQKKRALKKQKEIETKSVQESIIMTQKKEERVDLNAPDTMDAFIEQMKSENTMFLPTRCVLVFVFVFMFMFMFIYDPCTIN